MDFVILDVNDNVDVPLILGRPLLATSQALIDVSNGKMALRVGNEKVDFTLTDAMKHSFYSNDSWLYLDAPGSINDESMQDLVSNKPFKESLDDSQKEDAPTMVSKVEDVTHTHKKHWKVVPRSKKGKTKPFLKEITNELCTTIGKLPIFSHLGLELYDKETYTKFKQFSLLEPPNMP